MRGVIKPKILFTVLLVLSAVIYLSIRNRVPQTNSQTGVAFENESEAGSQNRLAWEFERLRDPQTGRIPDKIRQNELNFIKTIPTDRMDLYRGIWWNHRGPYNIGGRTRGMAIDVKDENNIFAGGVSGCLWKSVNGGMNWDVVSDLDILKSVTCIIQDTRKGKENNWYYGSGELSGNSASATGAYYVGNGVFKSTDNGKKWNILSSTSTNTPVAYDPWDFIWTLAIDTSNYMEDEIYAASWGTILRSTDGGINWTKVLGGVTGSLSYYSDIVTGPGGVCYAALSSDGADKGIWRSENGQTWTNITPSNFPSTFSRLVLTINPQNKDEIYVLGNTPKSGKKTLKYDGSEDWNSLWRYTNSVWTDLSANIPSDGTSNFDNFNSQGSYDLVVKFKPDNPNVLFIGGTNLYRSTDAFRTSDHTMQIGGYGIHTKRPNWIVYPNNHPDHHSLVFLPSNPNVMFNGNDGGVFRTDNCLQDTVVWSSLNRGYLTTQTYTVSIDNSFTNNILIAGFQDNGNLWTDTEDPTAIWTLPYNGDGSYSAIAPGGEFYIFSAQNARMAKMTLDSKGNRQNFARIDPIGGKDYIFINPFVLDPNNKDVLYMAGGRYLWRNDKISSIPMNNTYDSITYGWQKLSFALPFASRKITTLAVSTNPANVVYLGTNYTDVYRVENANTGDPVPVKLSNSNLPLSSYVSYIAVDPRDANKLMLVYSNYSVYSLFYSANGGNSWSKIAGNLEENRDGSGSGPSLRTASILHIKNRTLYLIGASTGLYATDSLMGDSTVWKQLGFYEFGNVVVEMIKTRDKDGLVVVATHGHGIYTSKLSDVDIALGIRKPAERSFEMKLYPNPASDYIELQYNIPAKEIKDIYMYDGNGKICNYLSSHKTASGHASFDISSLTTGKYFLTIRTANKIYSASFIKSK